MLKFQAVAEKTAKNFRELLFCCTLYNILKLLTYQTPFYWQPSPSYQCSNRSGFLAHPVHVTLQMRSGGNSSNYFPKSLISTLTK